MTIFHSYVKLPEGIIKMDQSLVSTATSLWPTFRLRLPTPHRCRSRCRWGWRHHVLGGHQAWELSDLSRVFERRPGRISADSYGFLQSLLSSTNLPMDFYGVQGICRNLDESPWTGNDFYGIPCGFLSDKRTINYKKSVVQD